MKLSTTYITDNIFYSQNVASAFFGEDGECSAGEYRFGFNGQEKEPEINPSVTSAEYWMYDGRLGRRWNLDPKPNPSISHYSTFAGNPIFFNDPFGDTVKIAFKGFLGMFQKHVNYVDGKLYNRDNSIYEGKTTKFLDNTKNDLDKLRDGGEAGKELVSDLQSSEHNVIIKKALSKYTNYYDDFNRENSQNPLIGSGGIIKYSQKSLFDSEGTKVPSFIILGHELAHSQNSTKGMADMSIWIKTTYTIFGDEKYATHIENMLRVENNIKLRRYYDINIKESAMFNSPMSSKSKFYNYDYYADKKYKDYRKLLLFGN